MNSGLGVATINSVMLARQVEMPCRDENENGNVDFAIYFAWKSDANNDGSCTIMDNIPGSLQGSCYCTRYDVPNVDVIVKTDPILPCI
jgi:hypothetical protein